LENFRKRIQSPGSGYLISSTAADDLHEAKHKIFVKGPPDFPFVEAPGKDIRS
jgi:hypothetical protein